MRCLGALEVHGEGSLEERVRVELAAAELLHRVEQLVRLLGRARPVTDSIQGEKCDTS